MSSLLTRIETALNDARRATDKPATLLLGTILSDIRNRALELTRELTDDDVAEVIRRGIKRRRESVEMFTSGGRHDLAAKEAAEVAILERYLPPQVSTDELRAAVREAVTQGATTVGAVMAKVMPAFKGRAEGGTISAIVREELASRG
jgi:uncharacterized protein